MIILQVLLTALVLTLPLLAGFCLNRKTLSETWLIGQVLLWALFEVLAIPMMHFRLPFQTLFLVFSGTAALLAAAGIVNAVLRKRRKERITQPFRFNLFFLLASLVILYQIGMYFFGGAASQELNTGSVANAERALANNFMRLRHAELDEYFACLYGNDGKDITALGLYLAWFSRITQVSPADLAGFVFPPFMILVSFNIFAQIGRQLFPESKRDQGISLLAISVLFLGLAYFSPEFSLARGWQEKALVPAIFLPLLVLLILQAEREKTLGSWLLLACGSGAVCLFSGLGNVLAVTLVMIYGGYVLLGWEFKRIPLLLLALAIPVMADLFYANEVRKLTGPQEFGGVQYCFDDTGEMITGWGEYDGKKYYADESGTLYHGGWTQVEDTRYFFRENGEMAVGWLEDGGNRYWLKEDGSMAAGWTEIAGNWYYFAESGEMKTGWQEAEGYWYYMNPSGEMMTGWQDIDGIRYYFRETGAMHTGWLEDTEAEKGLPEGQKQELWYWFDGNGAMATGTCEIDGEVQVFDEESGLWLYTIE